MVSLLRHRSVRCSDTVRQSRKPQSVYDCYGRHPVSRFSRKFYKRYHAQKIFRVHDVHIGKDFVSVRVVSAKYPSIWMVVWTTELRASLGRTLAIVQRQSKRCICRQLRDSQAAVSCQLHGQPEQEIVSADVLWEQHSSVYPRCVLRLARRYRSHCSSIAS